MSSCSRGGSSRSSRVCSIRRSPGSTNRCPSRICSLSQCSTCWSWRVSATCMVVLTQSSSRSPYRTNTRPPSATDSRVARSVCSSMFSQDADQVRRAEPVGVVGLLAADHLGRRAEHGREHRRGAGADRGHPPQAEEPAQPRVLDHELGVDLEVALQPLGGRDPLRLPGGDPAGLEPRLGPRVADLDQRLLEQPVVVVDHPARLAEALGVGLVGARPRAAARAGP